MAEKVESLSSNLVTELRRRTSVAQLDLLVSELDTVSAALADHVALEFTTDERESIERAVRIMREAAALLRPAHETGASRADELFGALNDFLNQWKNRGEETSLHEWHMRMKASAARAEAVLSAPGPHVEPSSTPNSDR